jgi:hypothetical protein
MNVTPGVELQPQLNLHSLEGSHEAMPDGPADLSHWRVHLSDLTHEQVRDMN